MEMKEDVKREVGDESRNEYNMSEINPPRRQAGGWKSGSELPHSKKAQV